MHEIPPQAEQLLRLQGVSDEELDELRRTGTLRRADGTGATIDVEVATDGSNQSTLKIDGTPLVGPGVPPALLEKLRRYHRFIPEQMRHSFEIALSQDIDGDGRIAGIAEVADAQTPTTTPTPAGGVDPWTGGVPASAHDHVEQPMHGYTASGAMPTGSTSGPFVGGAPGSGPSFVKVLLFLLVVAVVGFIAYEAFA